MNPDSPERHDQGEDTPATLYYQWVERYFEKKRAELTVIPEEERQLEEVGDYGYRTKIREVPDIRESSLTNPHYRNNNRFRTTEYFFDFDDTLFDTTGYNNAIWTQLETLGPTREEVVALYEASKIPDERTGEKMYRQDLFLDKLKERFPEQTEGIDNAFENVSFDDFIDEDMAHLLRLLTSSSLSRIHILTYGDVRVQRPKVEAVLRHYGTPMDVLYTQIPKADFLRRYLPEQYPYMDGKNTNVQNFVVVDDSATELEGLMQASKQLPFFVPLRLRKTTAKKSAREQEGEKAYEVMHQYARLLYEAARSLWELRNFGRVTPQEWQRQNVAARIQEYVEQVITGHQLKVRPGEGGTLVLSRRGRAFPGSDSIQDSEQEIGFDADSGTLYELHRDPAKGIVRKPYHPFYHDVLES